MNTKTIVLYGGPECQDQTGKVYAIPDNTQYLKTPYIESSPYASWSETLAPIISKSGLYRPLLFNGVVVKENGQDGEEVWIWEDMSVEEAVQMWMSRNNDPYNLKFASLSKVFADGYYHIPPVISKFTPDENCIF